MVVICSDLFILWGEKVHQLEEVELGPGEPVTREELAAPAGQDSLQLDIRSQYPDQCIQGKPQWQCDSVSFLGTYMS